MDKGVKVELNRGVWEALVLVYATAVALSAILHSAFEATLPILHLIRTFKRRSIWQSPHVDSLIPRQILASTLRAGVECLLDGVVRVAERAEHFSAAVVTERDTLPFKIILCENCFGAVHKKHCH